ncbi:MAG: glycosyltransferase [Ruminococcus sp.]|nr:glycosyltransferase [Ruminococcus sp.]
MIFMGPLFRREQEEYLLNLSKTGLLNAGNTFQWGLIDGICDNLEEGISIINVLPVGTWPNKFKKLVLKDNVWENREKHCYEAGCINLPFIKQFTRTRRVAKIIKKNFKNETELLICTAYMPFLKAVHRLPEKYKITLIITDLPEFSDMHCVSGLRRFLRNINNSLIKKYLKRVNRFVLLTEQMKYSLEVGDRPYTIVEGVCGYSSNPKLKSEIINDKIGILYTGRLNYRYGIKTLLDAFCKINRDDIELWICGSGEMENYITSVSEKDKRVKFMGYKTHDEILKLQRKAEILVNPRTNEGEYTKYSFPSKTMEYMASGTPVVMYKLDGVPNEYDEYLFYVENNSVEALKNKLEYVCNLSPECRKDFGEKARQFVLNQKNSKVQGKRILDLITDNIG